MDELILDIPDTESDNFAVLVEAAEEGVEALDTLRCYDQAVQLNPNETIAAEAYKFLRMSLANIQNRLGLEDLMVSRIATEAYQEDAVSKTLALEAISETAHRIWERLKEILKTIKKTIMEFFRKIKETLFGLDKHVEKISGTEISDEVGGTELKGEQIPNNPAVSFFAIPGRPGIDANAVISTLGMYMDITELFLRYMSDLLSTYTYDIRSQEQMDAANKQFMSRVKRMTSSYFKHSKEGERDVFTYSGGTAVLTMIDNTEKSTVAGRNMDVRFKVKEPERGDANVSVIKLVHNSEKNNICKEVEGVLAANRKLEVLVHGLEKTIEHLDKEPNDESVNLIYDLSVIYSTALMDLRRVMSINTRVAFQALKFAEMSFTTKLPEAA